MTPVLSLLLGILVILVITAFTGYFVAQEFAYMAVDRSRLKARASAGDALARRALQVTGRTSFMLSGAQLGITVTALLVGYVAEPLVGSAIGELLGGVGVPTGVGVVIGTVLALLLSTGVQMVFGELFPKNLAIARPEPVARALAASTLIYLKLLGWLIWVFDQSSNLLLRALRIEPVHDVEHSATARDLEHIVAESRAAGDLPEELSMLLDRVLDFPEQNVAHAMIPRVHVDTVEGDMSIAELRATMAGGHSRYPVLDEDDRVVGVVHLIDVLEFTGDAEQSRAGDLARDPLMLPTAMRLPDAVRELARTRNQLACVLDEHGGFDGVITVEDLAEELVGEITDEHDLQAERLLAVDLAADASSSSWTLAGSRHIDEVERAIEHDLPEGDYETVAGLLIDHLGRFPDVGDVITVELPLDPSTYADSEDPQPVLATFEVLEVEDHIPASVRLTLATDAVLEEGRS
ncbi:hemolysin family protein [Nocardioides sp. zg-DK7169]|uniref:hemolysin family protein n=1 Tax=Nocardioides sp. zg-DK7169 TaxID=2736600 RepID=UPI001555C3A7|nr:hemolysin family protein [Nocardioides sp. zg-DK7169]NPC96218.1 HlyC/CorC family transporter [Nocardioides sp. zg-DK7169]